MREKCPFNDGGILTHPPFKLKDMTSGKNWVEIRQLPRTEDVCRAYWFATIDENAQR